ncbi:MAG TPA: substrate-binding domain-containing protein [Polyangia bacterium]|jgi:ribose transport system substrate-binding protein|nr:substrate-binding domain-containing protein [Polyangia bacterium]
MTAARLAAAALTAALTVSCGQGGPGPARSDAAATIAAAVNATDAPGERRKAIRIAMIAKSATNPIFLSARTGAEAAARDLSAKIGTPIEIVWLTPAQEDGYVQVQRVVQAVNEGMTAILLSVTDADKITPTIDAAVARGVPVMTFDGDAPGSKRFAFFGVDDRRLGETVMKELAKQIGGRGKVAILAGNQAAANLRKRVDGVKTAAARFPGIKIVGTFHHVETPQEAVAEVIRVNKAYPDLRGWAMVGGWALFTKTLLTDAGAATKKIVAVDALPPELDYVIKGLAPVLLAQPAYLWGNVGVVKIVDKVHFHKDVADLPPMDFVKVTMDNLADWSRQLRRWGFADVPEEYLQLK